MENRRDARYSVAKHLEVEGNYVEHESGRYVERVNMASGKYLKFDENGRVDGFASLEQVFEYLELA